MALKIHWIHRSCYLIETPTGKVHCIESLMPQESRNIIIPYLYQKLGVYELESLIISHYHFNGHMGGAGTLIEGLNGRINNFYSTNVISTGNPETTYEPDILWQERLFDELEKYNINHEISKAGDSFQDGEVTFDIIGPLDEYAYPNIEETDYPNDESGLDVKISYGDFSFMFHGDKFKSGVEEVLTNMSDPTATIFHIPHHGDVSRIDSDMLNLVNPDFATPEQDRGAFDLLDDNNIDYHQLLDTDIGRNREGRDRIIIKGYMDGNYNIVENVEEVVRISKI